MDSGAALGGEFFKIGTQMANDSWEKHIIKVDGQTATLSCLHTIAYQIGHEPPVIGDKKWCLSCARQEFDTLCADYDALKK